MVAVVEAAAVLEVAAVAAATGCCCWLATAWAMRAAWTAAMAAEVTDEAAGVAAPEAAEAGDGDVKAEEGNVVITPGGLAVLRFRVRPEPLNN